MTSYSPFIENPTANEIGAALQDGRLTVEEILDPTQDLAPLLIRKTDDEIFQDAIEQRAARRFIDETYLVEKYERSQATQANLDGSG